MIDFKTFNLTQLPSVALSQRADLPTTPCIYFAIDSTGQVQYIGRSVNPAQRWNSHHQSKHLEVMDGVKIAYLSISDSSLLHAIEKSLILYFRPPLNGRTEVVEIKQLRERQKLRTADVASKLGIADSTVRNWEHGRTMPKLRIDQVAALCRLYQCSIDELEASVMQSSKEALGL